MTTGRHFPPSDKATIPPTLAVKVVGLSFVRGYPENLYALQRQADEGRRWDLELVREPQNPHDPNAVVVQVAADMEVLGHVPAALAARIAPELDKGVTWKVTAWQVLVAFGHESNPGLTIDLERSPAPAAASVD